MWYQKTIGGGRCPIVDTWWQTETGAIMITPLPGAIPTKPGSATLAFFGVDAAVVDERGEEVGANVGGKLIIRKPWPSMLRTIYRDKKRYQKQYWSEFKGCYLTGDGARRDRDGYFWIVGRIDDVLNVAGHRLGTSEIESALVAHAKVAEERESVVIPSAARDLALEVSDILVSSSAQSSFVRSFTSFRMTCAVCLDRACKRRGCSYGASSGVNCSFSKELLVSIRL